MIADPFPHMVIDGFLPENEARAIAGEFPAQDSPAWHRYANALEQKLTCNAWTAFGPATYALATRLTSPTFLSHIQSLTGLETPLHADPGLHGGGLHAHGPGGKLNVHLDYVLHPKLKLQRKLNILIYLNPDWREEWGGALGLWRGDASGPSYMVKAIAPIFNRAVIFDTTGFAWHGLPEPIRCPVGQMRQSFAAYYLQEPEPVHEPRTRALFAPTEEQDGDAGIAALIRARANEATAASVHRA